MASRTGRYRQDSAGEAAFRARMQDQCCLIEQYRLRAMKDEGRDLSRDEAALEWIELHAERFSQDREARG
jgi:hypothetical protein